MNAVLIPQVVCAHCSDAVVPEGGPWCKAHREMFRPKHLVQRSELREILTKALRAERGAR